MLLFSFPDLKETNHFHQASYGMQWGWGRSEFSLRSSSFTSPQPCLWPANSPCCPPSSRTQINSQWPLISQPPMVSSRLGGAGWGLGA